MNDWPKDSGEFFILIEWFKGFFCFELLLCYDFIVELKDTITVGYVVPITTHYALSESPYIAVSIWEYHHSIAGKKTILEIAVKVFPICDEHTQSEWHAFGLRPVIVAKFRLDLRQIIFIEFIIECFVQ